MHTDDDRLRVKTRLKYKLVLMGEPEHSEYGAKNNTFSENLKRDVDDSAR